MKTLSIFFFVMPLLTHSLHAQTQYGTFAGMLGEDRSYFGHRAGSSSTTTSNYNSFMGAYCGWKISGGDFNTAGGATALYSTTIGNSNVAIGDHTLYSNIQGSSNIALGRYALYTTAASNSIANGYRALYLNTGDENIAAGAMALRNNTSSYDVVAIGFQALYSNGAAFSNTAIGAYALNAVTDYTDNSAYGAYALESSTGMRNTAFGMYAGINLCTNTPFSGSFNTFFGAYSGVSPTANCYVYNTIGLGYGALVTASNQVRIGNADVTSIGGPVSWSTLSDGRFKKDIKKDIPGLEFITQLNPVSYTIDKLEYDKFLGIPDSMKIKNSEARENPRLQIGFVAQEVDDIVRKSGYQFSGVLSPQNEKDVYTIRYAEFVVPLTKAVQQLSAIADARLKKIEELKVALQPYLENQAQEQGLDTPYEFDGAEINITLSDVFNRVELIIYDLTGLQIKNIEVKERGRSSIRITNHQLSPGLYLYTIVGDEKVVAANELVVK
jgi:trimeric autotransporter adhesin